MLARGQHSARRNPHTVHCAKSFEPFTKKRQRLHVRQNPFVTRSRSWQGHLWQYTPAGERQSSGLSLYQGNLAGLVSWNLPGISPCSVYFGISFWASYFPFTRVSVLDLPAPLMNHTYLLCDTFAHTIPHIRGSLVCMEELACRAWPWSTLGFCQMVSAFLTLIVYFSLVTAFYTQCL